MRSQSEQVVVDLLVVLIEAEEEVAVVGPIEHSASLTDGVHAPHRRAHVHSLNSSLAGHDGPDGASAGRVILHHEFLQGDAFLFGHDLEEGGGDQIGCVALVVVDLGDHSLVDAYIVSGVVFFGVVGMDCMGHVGRD